MTASPAPVNGPAFRRGRIPSLAIAALFAIALASFYLPGGTASDCFGDHINFTGADLVVHAIPHEIGPAASAGGACADPPTKFTSGATQAFAILALLAAATGSVLALARVRRGVGGCAAVGLLATLEPGLGTLNPLGSFPAIALRVGADLALCAFAAALILCAGLGLWATKNANCSLRRMKKAR